MSYDVSIGDVSLNYTFNMARLFYDLIPNYDVECRGGLFAIDGLTGKEATGVLSAAFENINHDYCALNGASGFREKYDAPNGWGSTDGAMIFLARILAGCALNPRKRVSVSA
ncbi:hypothetical protein [Microcystis phage Mae-JY35]